MMSAEERRLKEGSGAQPHGNFGDPTSANGNGGYARITPLVHDPMWNRRTSVKKSGSETKVIWNPWIDKAKRMSDGARRMASFVETANAADSSLRLGPGGSHKLTASIRLERVVRGIGPFSAINHAF